MLCAVLTSIGFASCSKGETKLYEKNDALSQSIAYSSANNKTPTDSLRIGWSQSSSLNPFFVTANLNYDAMCLMYQSLYKTDSAYIPYEQIDQVDFTEDSVIVSYQGISLTIYLGEDAETEKFPRYMYNFIMELLENQ